MKNLLLIICLTISVKGYAQRPTGGCGYSVSLAGIVPDGDVDTLYNGTNYTAMLELMPAGDEIYGGLIKIHIDTILVGSGFYDPWGLPPAVNIGWLNFPPGIYRMKVMFGDYSCGGSWHGNVVIRDSVKTDTVQLPDTIAAEPPSQQIDTSGNIVIYPMPATGECITINGLRPSETDYELRITDMQGGAIPVHGTAINSSTLTVRIGNIPAGLYVIQLRTEERDIMMRLQVLK